MGCYAIFLLIKFGRTMPVKTRDQIHEALLSYDVC